VELRVLNSVFRNRKYAEGKIKAQFLGISEKCLVKSKDIQ